jgi:predicted nuclease of restriction endonuclease-like RecB superfamily
MLPLSLLITRTLKGRVKPVYASLTGENLALAAKMAELFKAHLGKPKGQLLDKLSVFEQEGFDYRLVRGLALILQRHCSFQVEAVISPPLARRLIFEQASRFGPIATCEDRSQVLQDVARQLSLTVTQLESAFYADLDEELVLTAFTPIPPLELLRQYNLALTQTLLFRSTFMEVKVSDNWKDVLRAVKFAGLMYTAETRGGAFQITVEGPLSLFKLTQRYGTSMARVLPSIVEARDWEINASIIRTSPFGKRILQLRLTSAEIGDKITRTQALEGKGGTVMFDSAVEEKFHRDFESLRSGWTITREPPPLIAGNQVLIPDFMFQKNGAKVYMEIMGFWTRSYLEKKLRKLQQLTDVSMLVAANEQLACDKLRNVGEQVIFYRNKVPLEPVFKYLKTRETAILKGEVDRLNLPQLHFEGDIVDLRRLAEKLGVSYEALASKLDDLDVDDYTRAGDLLVNNRKLQDVDAKLSSLAAPSLADALSLIETEGLARPYDVLSALNYTIKWSGLDPRNSSVDRKQS